MKDNPLFDGQLYDEIGGVLQRASLRDVDMEQSLYTLAVAVGMLTAANSSTDAVSDDMLRRFGRQVRECGRLYRDGLKDPASSGFRTQPIVDVAAFTEKNPTKQ